MMSMNAIQQQQQQPQPNVYSYDHRHHQHQHHHIHEEGNTLQEHHVPPMTTTMMTIQPQHTPQQHHHHHHHHQQQQQQQYSCLYTKQKTQKRKVWQDGRLVITNGIVVSLYSADPTTLCSNDKVLDQIELPISLVSSSSSTVQLLQVDQKIEMEHYLVQVEGIWKHPGVQQQQQQQQQHESTTSCSTNSYSMQKILSRKFQIPSTIIPPLPSSNNNATTTTTTTGSRPSTTSTSFRCKRRQPLQPGELLQQHYGISIATTSSSLPLPPGSTTTIPPSPNDVVQPQLRPFTTTATRTSPEITYNNLIHNTNNNVQGNNGLHSSVSILSVQQQQQEQLLPQNQQSFGFLVNQNDNMITSNNHTNTNGQNQNHNQKRPPPPQRAMTNTSTHISICQQEKLHEQQLQQQQRPRRSKKQQLIGAASSTSTTTFTDNSTINYSINRNTTNNNTCWNIPQENPYDNPEQQQQQQQFPRRNASLLSSVSNNTPTIEVPQQHQQLQLQQHLPSSLLQQPIIRLPKKSITSTTTHSSSHNLSINDFFGTIGDETRTNCYATDDDKTRGNTQHDQTLTNDHRNTECATIAGFVVEPKLQPPRPAVYGSSDVTMPNGNNGIDILKQNNSTVNNIKIIKRNDKAVRQTSHTQLLDFFQLDDNMNKNELTSKSNDTKIPEQNTQPLKNTDEPTVITMNDEQLTLMPVALTLPTNSAVVVESIYTNRESVHRTDTTVAVQSNQDPCSTSDVIAPEIYTGSLNITQPNPTTQANTALGTKNNDIDEVDDFVLPSDDDDDEDT